MTPSARAGATLQISLAPPDAPHAVHVVPHQIRQWGDQVDEILLTLDTHRIEGWYPEDWDERTRELDALVEELSATTPKLRAARVDYSPAATQPVRDKFFGGREIPAKDHTGACPIYAYFHGLAEPAFDHVLHVDSDMLFGGGSQTWIAEAKELLASREDVLFCAPLSGPPTADGEIPARVLERMGRWGGQFLGRDPAVEVGYLSGHISSRLFFIDRARFVAEVGPLRTRRPAIRGARVRLSASPSSMRRLAKLRLTGRSTCASFEDLMSHSMREASRVRLDFLGSPPGMWSLHPVARTEAYHAELPDLIRRVEQDQIPDGQRGDYDINDSMLAGASAPADVDDPDPRWRRMVTAIQGRRP